MESISRIEIDSGIETEQKRSVEDPELPAGVIDLIYTCVKKAIDGLYHDHSFDNYVDYVEKVLTISTDTYMKVIDDRLAYLKELNDNLLYSDEIAYLQLKRREFPILEDLKVYIGSKDFRKSQIDFVAGMSFLMLNYMLWAGMATAAGVSAIQKLLGEEALKIPIVAAYGSYEIVPGIGGLQAILSTAYALIRYSIPKSIVSIRSRKKIHEIPMYFIKAFANITDIGFLTMPLLINDDLTKSKIDLMVKVVRQARKPKQYQARYEDIYYAKPFISTTG